MRKGRAENEDGERKGTRLSIFKEQCEGPCRQRCCSWLSVSMPHLSHLDAVEGNYSQIVDISANISASGTLPLEAGWLCQPTGCSKYTNKPLIVTDSWGNGAWLWRQVSRVVSRTAKVSIQWVQMWCVRPPVGSISSTSHPLERWRSHDSSSSNMKPSLSLNTTLSNKHLHSAKLANTYSATYLESNVLSCPEKPRWSKAN